MIIYISRRKFNRLACKRFAQVRGIRIRETHGTKCGALKAAECRFKCLGKTIAKACNIIVAHVSDPANNAKENQYAIDKTALRAISTGVVQTNRTIKDLVLQVDGILLGEDLQGCTGTVAIIVPIKCLYTRANEVVWVHGILPYFKKDSSNSASGIPRRHETYRFAAMSYSARQASI